MAEENKENKKEETPLKEKEDFIETQLRDNIPEIRAGDIVRVHQKIVDK
ncbi:50S ribosomal protein L19, partial [Patescibacteria group bacterium]|nr:50S ribosomal protein L19 [Patescibacteria group bacterium]